jgi:hypothetical protein
MSLRLLTAFAIGMIGADFVPAADPPRPQLHNTSAALDILFNQEVQIEGNVNDKSLIDLVFELSKRYGITFMINEDCFKAAEIPDIREKKPNVAITNVRGLTLHQFLARVLESRNATYILKGNAVEVVTVAYAAKVAKVAVELDASGNISLKEPLVCAIIKQEKLSDAVEMLASRYDLSVTIVPQAGAAAASAVSARMMNLPVDKAIELLAVQCDLRVVREGNAFLITSREHAKTLLAEQVEKDRQKIELEKLRESIPRNAVGPQQKSDPQSPPKPIPELPAQPRL